MKKTITTFIMLFTFILLNNAQQNLVTNPTFTNEAESWTLTYQQQSDKTNNVYQLDFSDGLTIEQENNADGRLDISQLIPVQKNTAYKLSFQYKATHKKLRIWSYLISNNDTWVYLTDNVETDSLRTLNKYLDTTSVWTTYTCHFTTPDVDTIPTFNLMFRKYKQKQSTMRINNVQLVEVNNSPMTNITNLNTNTNNGKFIDNNGLLYIKHDDNVYTITGTKIY